MELVNKTAEEIVFVSDMSVSLANAIRRSVAEVPVLAIVEADIYKNDSALYDEIIAHRLGLVPLKNQKMKRDQVVEIKMRVKAKGENFDVLAGELDADVVYPEMPIVLLKDGQQIELVARAKSGKGIDHARFMPGLAFYKHLPKIKISAEGEKQSELAELYPESFEMFGEKLKVKNAAACDLDQDDLADYPGISIEFDNNLVFTIESWGQMNADVIFTEACKALKENLSEVSKAIR
jgi:DNA-directed RNA polymerase subunit D